MSDYLVKIPLSGRIKQGDTIHEINIKLGDEYDGDLTTATIKMQLYDGSVRVLDLSNGNGITVVSSNEMNIDEILENDLPAKKLIGDLEVTESDGKRTTYFDVQYTISKQYTV